ncbi:IclR family transcriptional regulator [Streptomyces sp. NPDC101234]|uniref:IclR family transcriptional regulator n=1 Tax=Streptomyces sp. NPDC101234 TaxID=3366138 RepID=UPI00381AE8B1
MLCRIVRDPALECADPTGGEPATVVHLARRGRGMRLSRKKERRREDARMGLKTVERLGDLLTLFTVARPEWSLAEVTRELGVPRSTAHGLLVSVAAIGLLHPVGRGRYRLGPRITELNAVRMRRRDVREAAVGVLHSLTAETGETSNLGVLVGSAVLYLDSVPGHHHVSVTGAHPGTRVAAARTAIGKVLLAHQAEPRVTLTEERAAEVLAGTGLQRREAEAIRRDGIGYDLGDVSPEIRCLAAPIRDEVGTVVAAVSISTTSARFARHHDRLAEHLKEAAIALSERLRSDHA